MKNCRLIKRGWYAVLLISVWAFLSGITYASLDTGNDVESLFDLSIEELMKIEIELPASLTEKNPLKIPASVTVITAEDIARTPARNLLDLLEVYVPGFMYMNHSIGPLPGLRGILVDRPYKFLVNVNGMNVNIKSYYGARLELLNWEMSDIARVEVIRGPGSVTYGPGAIAGVINITTRTAKDAPGLALGGRFWGKYNSIGQYLSYGYSTDAYDLYSYVSAVHTDGVEPALFSSQRRTSGGVITYPTGYLGTPGGPYDPAPPQTYMTDFFNEPQIKAHVDVQFKNNWRLWMRYGNSSSQLIQNNATQYSFNGKYKDFRQTRYRYYQFTLQNQTDLTDTLNLRSTFGLSSIDVHEVSRWHNTQIPNPGRNNLRNLGGRWSENEYYSRFMLNYDPDNDKFKAALGFELSYDTIRPGWGQSKDSGFRMSDGIISGPSSDVYVSGSAQTGQVSGTSARYYPVGKGWETWSHAFLGELNMAVTPKSTAILSARLDKHSYTDYMFSPRVAWIYELDKTEYLKFIAQRSVRMNTQEELYMSHKEKEKNQPEKLDTLETIYTNRITDAFSIQTSVFHNRNEVIAWDWGQRRAAPVGTLKTIGIEFEADYKKDNFNIGLNHSFVKQLDWKLAKGVSAAGISYSDYDHQMTTRDSTTPPSYPIELTSKGNDLNNWANHATKLYGNVKLLDGKMTLHGNMRAYWDFKGLKDGLAVLERAGGPAADSTASVRKKGAYKTQITANVSLTYHITPSADLTLFVHNIDITGKNKRYSYSSGFRNEFADKTSWIEEPTVLGVQYRVRF